MAATAAQQMVCGLQYHRSRERRENSYLFEKLLSENLCRKINSQPNLTIFLQRHLILQDANNWWQGQGGILSVGDGVIDHGVHPKCINLIEKIEHVQLGDVFCYLL